MVEFQPDWSGGHRARQCSRQKVSYDVYRNHDLEHVDGVRSRTGRGNAMNRESKTRCDLVESVRGVSGESVLGRVRIYSSLPSLWTLISLGSNVGKVNGVNGGEESSHANEDGNHDHSHANEDDNHGHSRGS